MLNNIKDLKKESILLKDGKTSIDGRTVRLNDFVLDPHKWGYSVRNGRICYITRDGELYLVQYSQQAIDTIKRNGYQEKKFYFPFCDGDYPVFA